MPEADKSKAKQDFKYEELYTKIFDSSIKLIKTDQLPKNDMGSIQIVKLNEKKQFMVLYRSITKNIMWQGRVLETFGTEFMNKLKDALKLPVLYLKKTEEAKENGETETK